MRSGFLFSLALTLAVALSPFSQRAWAAGNAGNLGIFITGLSGELSYKTYLAEGVAKFERFLLSNGYHSGEFVEFSETGEAETASAAGKKVMAATKENLKKFFEEQAEKKAAYENVFLFIAGHANGHDENAVFHLPGQDVNYAQFFEWIEKIPAKKILIVHGASQGDVWIKKLSGADRVIITGSGDRKVDFIPIVFLRTFPKVLTSNQPGAMTISLKDAFIETQRKVQNWYWTEELHPTEIAMIDADGDGKGESLIAEIVFHEKSEISDSKNKGKKAAEAEELKKELELVFDENLPDAQKADELIFTLPWEDGHGY